MTFAKYVLAAATGTAIGMILGHALTKAFLETALTLERSGGIW